MWKKEVTRTRRATRHANIGFSVRTFGPSARETFIRRFISAIHGWMATDGERDRAPYEKAEHTPRTTFSPAKFHGDRPTDRPTNQRRANDVKTRANVLPIGYRGKSRKSRRAWFPQVFPFVVTVVDVFLFLSVAAKITFPQVTNIF